MSLLTYSDLQSAVADYLARGDLTARIPDFITLAEAKFNRSLYCYQMEKRSTTAFVLTNAEPEFVTLPTDFQIMRRIRLSGLAGKPPVEYRPQASIDEFRAMTCNVTGRPLYFTVFGTEIEFAPTPDAAYTIEMVYRAKIPALSVSNTSNWLLLTAPDAYLYGTLLEATPYMKEDARIQVWAAGLSSTVEGLNELSKKAQFNAGPLIVRTSSPTP